MSTIKKIAIALIIAISSISANAGCLWPLGDALSCGWSIDNATAILSTKSNADIYVGTVYLKANQDFKFLTTTDFGNEEIGAAPGAELIDGTIKLAKGTNDEGYGKIKVAESANYLIVINTAEMTATIEKSVYQDSEINLSSLFMVGSAAPEGWDVMLGAPLYQDSEAPYKFAATDQPMKAGTFKIATTLKGACTWDAKYWYFRNESNPDKIALNQPGDLQWEITEEQNYNIRVNLKDESISIVSSATDGAEVIVEDETDAAPEYYTVTGVKVENPVSGLYICKRGNKATKVFIR